MARPEWTPARLGGIAALHPFSPHPPQESSVSAAELRSKAQAIHDRYRANFAGRSRATRDLSLLHGILDEMSGLRGDVARSGDAELLSQVDGWTELYQREQAAIAEVQQGGPDVATAHRLGDWGFLDYQRYLRHFAGQNRTTRDSALLRELVDAQRARLDRFRALAARQESGWQADIREALEGNLAVWEKEREEIPKARQGLAPDRRASVLATRANGQFALYRLHFAGQKRSTRRLGLLRRMIGELSDIHQEMLHLRDQKGVRTESHTGNIQKVSERIQHHKREFRAIEQARGQQSPGQRSQDLANEANGLFGQYREEFAGKPRESRNLDRLGEINDQLYEAGRTMQELTEELDSEVLRKNLDVVVDNLKRYEREYRAIREAQAPKIT